MTDAARSPARPRRRLAVLAAIVLTLAMFAVVDRWLGTRGDGGPYRQEIGRPIAAVLKAPRAQHIVLGCSTSNWFPSALASAWHLKKHEWVDAHMSDCLQACTMAEVRRLVRMGKHFETATFGVNAFEYCEDYRERRSMQEVELMPWRDTFELARVYAHSQDPLQYAGGWLMNHLSLVYGNTMWLQRHHRKRWFGNESLDSSWFAKQPAVRSKRDAFRCDYASADRDYGLAATEGALRALEALADRVQLVVLPDKALADAGPEAEHARELFLSEHRALAARFGRVALIELLEPKLLRRELFRDGAHLNRRGVDIGVKLLARRLPERPKPSAAAVPQPTHQAGEGAQ